MPSRRFPVGDGGKSSRRNDHPHRSTVHPHVGDGRFPCAASRRSDIAFLGGIIKYILDNERVLPEYVVNYTNAATIVNEDFVDTEQLDGLFSGYNPTTGAYDTTSWSTRGWSRLPRPDAGCSEPVREKSEPVGTSSVVGARRLRTALFDVTRPCRIPSASFNSQGHYADNARRWSSRSAASTGAVRESLRGCHREQRPRAHDRVGVFGGGGRNIRSASSTSAAPR